MTVGNPPYAALSSRPGPRLANNPVITRPEIGQTKPPSYAIPSGLTFGRPNRADAEGAAGVMASYLTHQQPERLVQKVEPKRDFVAVNRDALRSGCKNANDITQYRGAHKPMIKIAQGRLDKGTTNLPSKQDQAYTYGVRNKPSTPISGVISGSYAAPDEPKRHMSFEEAEAERIAATKPMARHKIKRTKNERERQRAMQRQKEEEEKASRQFKLKKFQKTNTRVYERGPNPGRTFARTSTAGTMASRGSNTHTGAIVSAHDYNDTTNSLAATDSHQYAGADQPRSFDAIQKKIRRTLKKRGAHGIRGLGRAFRIMDDSGNRALSRDEFGTSLGEYGIDLTEDELDMLMNHYDRNGDGVIIYDEFLTGLRGELNPKRMEFVHAAFRILDTDGSGVVTLDEIASKYDVSGHPEVLAGRLTPEEALRDFMSQWDSKSAPDGMVTLAEFENYHKDLSASIDSDEYWELSMRNAWHLSGGSGQSANTSNRRVLCTWADMSQTIETIENDLGIGPSDIGKMKQRIYEQTGKTPKSIQLA